MSDASLRRGLLHGPAPPLGFLLVGGLLVALNGMVLYFTAFALPLDELAASAASTGTKLGTVALAIVSAILVLVGLAIVAGWRRALPAVPWLVAVAAVVKVVKLHGQTLEPGLVAASFVPDALIAGLAWLAWRAARSGSQLLAETAKGRIAILAGEACVAVLLVSMTASWFLGNLMRVELPEPTAAGTTAASLETVDFGRQLRRLDGEPRPLRADGATLTLVNYWATWCGPCIAELPDLMEIARAHGDRGLEVVLVNVETRPDAEVRAFLEKRGVDLPCAVGAADSHWPELREALGRDAIPVTVLLGAPGEVLDVWTGRPPRPELEHRVLRSLARAGLEIAGDGRGG